MKKAGFVLLVIVFTISCAKWVSVDISEDSIVLISPIENQADSLQKKTFVWEELEGADKYRLQIASPDFSSISYFALDSLVTRASFTSSLIPKTYQWRVRGENDDFNSAWSTRNLTILTSTSLANQEITGLTPESGFNTNKMTQNFSWNELVSANEYSVTIVDEDDKSTFVKVKEVEYSYTFPKEGLFTVNIQAINDASASLASSISIRIDTTAPSDITLSSPADTLDSDSFPHTFSWSVKSVNKGSEITDTLFIASDSLLTKEILKTSLVSVTSLTLDTIEALPGKLYWKINRGDAAGNSNTSIKSKRFWIK